MTKIATQIQTIMFSHTKQPKFLDIILDPVKKAQLHHYKLVDAQVKETLILQLGEHINLTSPMITSSDVEEFCTKMKELIEIFDEVNGHFKEFIEPIFKTMSSIFFVNS
jgi:hypothetical protein